MLIFVYIFLFRVPWHSLGSSCICVYKHSKDTLVYFQDIKDNQITKDRPKQDHKKKELMKELKGLSSIHQDIPDAIVDLVEEIINRKGSKLENLGNKAPDKRVVLNIWDFAGHCVYYTNHQVWVSHIIKNQNCQFCYPSPKRKGIDIDT